MSGIEVLFGVEILLTLTYFPTALPIPNLVALWACPGGVFFRIIPS
ncbi:hypothetical protein Cabys_3765 [Caldithrix abyssi DSM 13497]|uniref:Uncharacterized protein n=1 Tax=Caldithrix abyssi DSM 13497 TaxID=880073 RepID=A0A1J1CD72_CALAY|nr:hypothetical protein Cabys_3765 [Caldithrix abyssi DSM 13497]